MEVIKEGKLTTEVTCECCKAQLRIEPCDVTYDKKLTSYDITCPCCKLRLDVRRQLPNNFKASVRQR